MEQLFRELCEHIFGTTHHHPDVRRMRFHIPSDKADIVFEFPLNFDARPPTGANAFAQSSYDMVNKAGTRIVHYNNSRLFR